MIWGKSLYNLIKILIKKPCEGYYLRWYYNGWHYWFFQPGRYGIVTEGEKYRTISVRKILMGTGVITRSQAMAIRTIMNTREVYLLTIAGWMNIRLEPGSLIVYDHSVEGIEIEITAYIGSKEISYDDGYTPVPNIPVIFPVIGYCERVIGNQIWMCYNWDGNFPGSKVYDNNESNRSSFGGLYTFNQVNSPGFAPSGWHVPTLTEWQKLINYIGGIITGGGILKETGLVYWQAPNAGALDIYNFSARGNGGFISYFLGLYQACNLWTATEASGNNGYFIQMVNHAANIVAQSLSKNYYFGVRLIKDTAAPPLLVYAGTSPNALILRSNNSGISFYNLGSSGHGNILCFCKLSNNNILYGTNNGWIININTGHSIKISNFGINAIIADPSITNIICGDSDGELYQSNDHGISYFSTGNVGGAINTMIFYNDTMPVSFGDSGVYNGLTLLQAGNFKYGIVTDSLIIYTGDNNGHLWKNIDIDDPFIDLGLVSVGAFTSLIISGVRLLFTYAATFSIGYTDDEGASHTWVNTGVDIPICLAKIEGNILLAGTSNGHIYRSIDNGNSWGEIAGNPQFGETSINAILKA